MADLKVESPEVSPKPREQGKTSESNTIYEVEGGHLLGHLLRFGQLLRLMGLEVGTNQMLDLVQALEYVPITQRDDFYFTCQALLVSRREDLLVFDQAFRLFWRILAEDADGDAQEGDAAVRRVRLPSEPEEDKGGEQEGAEQRQKIEQAAGDEESVPDPLMVYSPLDVLRDKDFGQMTWEEIQEAKRAIASLEWKLGERRTRRARTAAKGKLNLRRMIRDNLRHGGEPLHRAFRTRIYRPRSLVVLCDISGSMERYSRMLLHFIHALTHGMRDTYVEAFVFGTRLTRITRHLRYKDVDESLDELNDVVRDWAGGTRIGEALKAFNFQWARRVLGRGPVVLIISDGWDRGNLDLLAKEISRLQHSSYRLMWLNPLLGIDEYRPIQRGMATVMPCVDDFLPLHNLSNLQQLADVLSSVTDSRPARKQRACAPESDSALLDIQKSQNRHREDWSASWAAWVSQH